MSSTRHIHISYFRIAWVFVLALQDFNYKCSREIIHKDGIMPASNYEMSKKWSDSWLVDPDHAWCCLLCCLILETSIRIPKQPLISAACFCKLSLSNVSRLSVCRPWKDKHIIKEDYGDDLDGHGVVAPGHLAHPVPPLTQHKVLLQRRKFVDVQNL